MYNTEKEKTYEYRELEFIKIFILALQGIKPKSQCCPSNNITSYVTSKHLRILEQHVGRVFKSNSVT